MGNLSQGGGGALFNERRQRESGQRGGRRTAAQQKPTRAEEFDWDEAIARWLTMMDEMYSRRRR